MVGRENLFRTLAALLRRELSIGGDVDVIADLRDRGRVLEMAVAIDHQTRIAAEQQRCVKPGAQPPTKIGNPDIPGDMLIETDGWQPKITQLLRHMAPGVIAKQDQRCRSGWIDQLEGGRIVRKQKWVAMHLTQARHARNRG